MICPIRSALPSPSLCSGHGRVQVSIVRSSAASGGRPSATTGVTAAEEAEFGGTPSRMRRPTAAPLADGGAGDRPPPQIGTAGLASVMGRASEMGRAGVRSGVTAYTYIHTGCLTRRGAQDGERLTQLVE